LDFKHNWIFESIKTLVIEIIRYRKNNEIKVKYSAYIESVLNGEDNYLINQFLL